VLSASEIARGVQGAFGLLRRDPTALLAFDNTMEACLRSFRVMAVSAPIYAIYALIHYAGTTVAIEPVEVVVVEALNYVVQWLLYPVIFYEVARRRGWLALYPRYIGALNWTGLPAIAIATIAIVLKLIVPAAMGDIIDIATQVLFFYWFLVTTRMALGVDWLMATILLAVNWIPAFFLSILVARYVGILGGGA